MKRYLIVLLLLFAFIYSEAQPFTAKYITLTRVFNTLVNAYGNAKGKPNLVLIPIAEKESYCIAGYFTTPKPTIKVDEKLFDICMGFGTDSLNALSIVLSHELAHYYNDHNWCSDFAFAIRNTPIGKKIAAETKNNNLSHEREADNFGLYHSCIAGYKPFGADSALLEKIYKSYDLPTKMAGYPTKAERIGICKEAEKQIAKLYSEFKEGDSAIYHKDFERAIRCFEDLTKYFPSRENYHNAGTAKALWALRLKPLERIEFDDANFYYPIEVDHVSRLYGSGHRSLDEHDAKKMDELLQSAKRDFEKAITLDPDYEKAYINLACVFDLLGNPESAIGKIKELPANKQEQQRAYRILGIAYYHLGNKEKSEEMFKKVSRTIQK